MLAYFNKMRHVMPPRTSKLLENYLGLRIGKSRIQCPYYQNVGRNKGRPVFVGKGLPQEIECETAKLLGNSLNHMDFSSIKLYMVMAGLGVDCSGFVLRLLDSFLRETVGADIMKSLKPVPRSLPQIARLFIRPYTNVSANMITSSKNTYLITNYDELLPGDLIRVGSGHVAIVIEVLEKSGKTKTIKYAHSTSDYLDQYGVRTGDIFITKPHEPLESQKWSEIYKDKNWMYEDYLRSPAEDRGLRRLKILADSVV